MLEQVWKIIRSLIWLDNYIQEVKWQGMQLENYGVECIFNLGDELKSY